LHVVASQINKFRAKNAIKRDKAELARFFASVNILSKLFSDIYGEQKYKRVTKPATVSRLMNQSHFKKHNKELVTLLKINWIRQLV